VCPLQIDFFGLRFVNKKLQMRWLDLDKAIKKQMDKHSQSPLLYFGVMFYIHDVQHLKDPLTRSAPFQSRFTRNHCVTIL
jgi:tyrosine-protein phosphatase non-receptor type 14/21